MTKKRTLWNFVISHDYVFTVKLLPPYFTKLKKLSKPKAIKAIPSYYRDVDVVQFFDLLITGLFWNMDWDH